MSRRKKSPTKKSLSKSAEPHVEAEAEADVEPHVGSQDVPGSPSEERSKLPSARIRFFISALVVVHFVAISLSMTAVVASSDTQARLNGWFQPYTMPTHFRTQGERLFLTAGEESESPLRIQVQRQSSARLTSVSRVAERTSLDATWETIQPPGMKGLGANDRQSRWLASVMTLVNSESPSLVAELLLPMLRDDESITAIRIVRLSSDLSLDYETFGELDDGTQLSAVPYTAVVVRRGESTSLVRVNEARLSTFNKDIESKVNESAGSGR
jgi:hypothetical protein